MGRRGSTPNACTIVDGVAHIELTGGRFALVDVEDLPSVVAIRWVLRVSRGSAYAYGYSTPRPNRAVTHLHWEVLGKPPSGMVVDHINGDGLDNRRCNLRFATHSQNLHNQKPHTGIRSGFKGVSTKTYHGKKGTSVYHQAYICTGRTRIHLGYFNTPEEAAEAHNKAALEMRGEFARLNP